MAHLASRGLEDFDRHAGSSAADAVSNRPRRSVLSSNFQTGLTGRSPLSDFSSNLRPPPRPYLRLARTRRQKRTNPLICALEVRVLPAGFLNRGRSSMVEQQTVSPLLRLVRAFFFLPPGGARWRGRHGNPRAGPAPGHPQHAADDAAPRARPDPADPPATWSQQDPRFYVRLAAWYNDHGDVRDHKEMFVVTLALSDFEGHRDVGLALLRRLPPYQVVPRPRLHPRPQDRRARSVRERQPGQKAADGRAEAAVADGRRGVRPVPQPAAALRTEIDALPARARGGRRLVRQQRARGPQGHQAAVRPAARRAGRAGPEDPLRRGPAGRQPAVRPARSWPGRRRRPSRPGPSSSTGSRTASRPRSCSR